MTQSDDILDLLKNEYFVQWIVTPTQESTHYWSKWIASHPERKQDVQTAIQVIKSGKYQIDEKMPENHYDQVLENIVNHSLRSRRKKPKLIRFPWKPFSIAASITFILFSSIYILWDRPPVITEDYVAITQIRKEAPNGTKITTRLPDGSMVTLNSGSWIAFPDEFSGDTREVSLSGEAFFEVEHNPEKPFYVNMNGHQVRVLGTSFNIRSYAEDSVVHVSVATGRVSYTIPSGERAILAPDQMATYLPKDGSLVTGEVDRLLAFGWKDKIIYFKSTTFDNMITELERWYGVKIDVNGDYNQVGTFSGKFRNETLIQVLTGLSSIYQFEFNIEGTKVTLNKSQPNP